MKACGSKPPEASRFPGDEDDWNGCVCALPVGHESDHKCERKIELEREVALIESDAILAIVNRENEFHSSWPIRIEELTHR